MIPRSFTLLPTPLPPMLLPMAGVVVETRFIGLYYLGSKATWTDGRSSRTFPFSTVWQPYTRHPAMLFPLASLGVHLGADDREPTHQLVSDRTESRVYVAAWTEANRFLANQHPPLRSAAPAAWEAVKAAISSLPQPTMTQMQQLGMFEWFSSPTPPMLAAQTELVTWLNQYIDRSQIEYYAQLLNLSPEEVLLFLEGQM